MEHSAILLTCIKLPFFNKIFVLSIFEWLFYTGFTVRQYVSLLKSPNFDTAIIKWFTVAQHLSGEVLNLRLKGCWFKAHRKLYVASLSKTHH